MEDDRLSQRHEDLLETVKSIISFLKIEGYEENKKEKEDKKEKKEKEDKEKKEGKKDNEEKKEKPENIIQNKINQLQIEDKEEEEEEELDVTQNYRKQEEQYLNHFSFFIKKLFLNENGIFDFNVETLKNIIGEQMVKSIFDLLIRCINSKNFFSFIYELGELFVKKNLDLDEKDKFYEVIEEFENKGINNYECMFLIFTMCKNYKGNQYISDNYDIYYRETYLIEIKYNLIFAIERYINLCVNPDEEMLSLNVEEENTSDDSNNKPKKTNFEKLIMDSVNTFWCNSNFLYNVDIACFLNIFYDFINQNSKNVFNKIVYDDSIKDFLKYMSIHLEKLFRDLNADSLKEFGISLFNYVIEHKNQNIKLVERAIQIGEIYHLNEETIGLISFILCNNKFITDLEEMANSEKKFTDKDIQNLVDTKQLSDNETYIATFILIDEVKYQKEKKNLITNSNNLNDIDIKDNNKDEKKNKSLKEIDEQKKKNHKKKIYINY